MSGDIAGVAAQGNEQQWQARGREFRQQLFVLAPLFALALAVRVPGLGWGLPNASRWYSYHPDESARQMVGAVASLLQSGDFNPHFFNYPSLSIYATWAIYQLMALFGVATDVAAPDYPWPVVRDIIFAGRCLSVGCGALTAPLLFLLARRLGAGKWAILAGVLLALAPGHVQHSHFATVDVPATFWVTLCLYLSLRAQNGRALLGAALVAGLAAGTKYNAGLVLLAPWLRAFWLPSGGAKWRSLGAQSGAAALGFLVTTPYALLAPREFWGDGLRGGQSGFAFEMLVHPRLGSGDLFQNTGNGWLYHFGFNAPFLLTWPLLIGALVGIGFALPKRHWWPVLAFGALFFFALGLSQVRFMRYGLPLVPLGCLLAAYGAARLPQPRVGGALLVAFALWGTRDALWPLLHLDSRDAALGAIAQRSGRVVLEHPPWFYTPPFQPQGFNQPVAGVVVAASPQTVLRRGDVLVRSEFEWREPARLDAAARRSWPLDGAAFRVAVFRNQTPWALPGRAFVPTDYLYTHPETRVYQRR